MEYPWYELLDSSDEITQGDIIKRCQVPILKELCNDEKNSTLKAQIEIIDGIVMTQACDIANNKISNIILCSITSKEEFENSLRSEGRKDKEIGKIIQGISQGRQSALHIIDRYVTDDFAQDYYIINFKEIFSIPIEVAKSTAKANGRRLRLCPPYREHLSQAFARYFMRVGLPINIHFE